MSDPHGPIWIVNAPAQAYPDGRFDGVTTIPPLNPQQPTPTAEQLLRVRVKELERERNGLWQGNLDLIAQLLEYAPIVNATRLAADDMQTVLRHWTFPAISELPSLKALVALLTPPAPAWQAKEENE